MHVHDNSPKTGQRAARNGRRGTYTANGSVQDEINVGKYTGGHRHTAEHSDQLLNCRANTRL